MGPGEGRTASAPPATADPSEGAALAEFIEHWAYQHRFALVALENLAPHVLYEHYGDVIGSWLRLARGDGNLCQRVLTLVERAAGRDPRLSLGEYFETLAHKGRGLSRYSVKPEETQRFTDVPSKCLLPVLYLATFAKHSLALVLAVERTVGGQELHLQERSLWRWINDAACPGGCTARFERVLNRVQHFVGSAHDRLRGLAFCDMLMRPYRILEVIGCVENGRFNPPSGLYCYVFQGTNRTRKSRSCVLICDIVNRIASVVRARRVLAAC